MVKRESGEKYSDNKYSDKRKHLDRKKPDST